MSFKEKMLSKSNSYAYYKHKNESLNKEINSLKSENEKLKNEIENIRNERNISLKDEYFKKYGLSGAFSNWDYVDFYLDDEFETNFHEITKNLDNESKKLYKWIFLRTLFVNLVTKDTVYLDYELKNQKKFTDFKITNAKRNEIAGYKFTGDYNLHAFMDLGLTDEDKVFLKDKDIIDAGAFTGDTSIPLSQITNSNVYAFEPFEESYGILTRNIEDNGIENIVPIKKSLGNINGERELFLSGSNVQGITSDPNIRNFDKVLKVEEITLDTFVKENDMDIGLITIDVEGAEMDLLNGALNTIKVQKPILHISIYHKASDFFGIIPWIANLDLGYEFKVVKEQPWPFLADTVIQCRVK